MGVLDDKTQMSLALSATTQNFCNFAERVFDALPNLVWVGVDACNPDGVAHGREVFGPRLIETFVPRVQQLFKKFAG